MNPDEIADKPGKDSMGMDMVAEEITVESGASESAVADLAKIRMSGQKRQLIGVRTAPVRKVAFVRSIRAVGRVAPDESRLSQVTTKIDGYVERLYANAVGEAVRKGEPLLEIYSPELLASQNEFLVALAARKRTAGSSLASVAGFGDDLVASARRRLQLFDLTADQIDRLERTGRPERVVTIYAPISGVITARDVAQGQKIASGTTILEVVDLSRLWVLASVYEYELPFVHAGQAATMTLSYLPGKALEGKVAFVYPTLDPQTRTATVRVEFPNPGMELKPDMFAEVVLQADLGHRLSVPDSAVLETGTRSITFVESGEGVFEPRQVEIGLRLESEYEIVKGLSEGERVVVSGNFLIDSESRLKAALAGMSSASESPSAPSGHSH
jgi:RND family efflux transporter MFP subunit